MGFELIGTGGPNYKWGGLRPLYDAGRALG
jgi:hypothetical protein